MKSTRTIRIILAVILICAFAVPAAFADFSAIVTSSSMKVYQNSNKTGASVKLGKGTVVRVSAYKGNTAKIKYNGYTGYASVSSMKSVASTAAYTTVASSGAKVYKSASTSASYKRVSAGTAVYVLSVSGSWARVEKGGCTGYIKKSDLTLYSAATASTKSKVKTVFLLARSKLGCRYVYARSGPNTFDCAGFVKYCFSSVGISLGSSAKAIGYGKGTKVSMSQLRAGDIVCFNTVSDSDLTDHVGIYIGDGYFVHCSSGAMKVLVSTLKSGYYRKVFSWGMRVL